MKQDRIEDVFATIGSIIVIIAIIGTLATNVFGAEQLDLEAEKTAENRLFDCGSLVDLERGEEDTLALIKMSVFYENHPQLLGIEKVENDTGMCPCLDGEPEPVAVVQNASPKMYGVDGYYMDAYNYLVLKADLDACGIGWWLPYAVCQAFQESTFNPLMENVNGLDKGLFQYRITFWPGRAHKYGVNNASIFDPVAQCHVYAQEMASRLNSGKSIEQALSDHYTGGQGFDSQYVSDVLRWMSHLTTKP